MSFKLINVIMNAVPQREKWARWPQSKVELFLKVIVVFWTPKLKRDVENYLNGTNLPLVHLEHKKVKKSTQLLDVPQSDSKSLQIKYVRVVESFPRKPSLPQLLLEAIKMVEESPHLNFLLGPCYANPIYRPLFAKFNQLVESMTDLVMTRRPQQNTDNKASIPQTSYGTISDQEATANDRLFNDEDCFGSHKIDKKRRQRLKLPPERLRKSNRLASKVKPSESNNLLQTRPSLNSTGETAPSMDNFDGKNKRLPDRTELLALLSRGLVRSSPQFHASSIGQFDT